MVNLQRGFVYLVFLESGQTKVGMSRSDPKSRIDAARRIVEKSGLVVSGSWVSQQVMNRYTDENKLILKFSTDGHNIPSMGSEWFSGIDRVGAIAYAESVFDFCPDETPMLNPPVPMRVIRIDEVRFEAFKEHLGTDWLRKQIDRAIKKDQRKPTAQKTEG